MSLQVGERLHHKQPLVWRRCRNFLVLQYPGLVVGHENGVQACGEGGVDIGLWAILTVQLFRIARRDFPSSS